MIARAVLLNTKIVVLDGKILLILKYLFVIYKLMDFLIIFMYLNIKTK